MFLTREFPRAPRAACFAVLCLLTISVECFARQEAKSPVVVIHGMVGSELVNRATGEVAWFRLTKVRGDNLRLPLSPDLAANRDDLVVRDILRSTKVGLARRKQVYGSLIEALTTRGGYEERAWDNPAAENALYVFAYDWRRDNVENARLLVQKIEAVKQRLRRPDLRFDVVAHSMGGLITRYAAMYGDADLPAGRPRPTWAGAEHFGKIFLLGAPNEGSLLALNSLVNGVRPFGINITLPFVQSLTRFDIFTAPAVFQLLPHDGALRAFDENLKPLEIDIYDPQTWDKYGWSPLADKKFAAQFGADERRAAKGYFLSALGRAERFQEALNAGGGADAPLSMTLVGGDCQDTLDAVVVRRDGEGWATLFKPSAFRRGDGRRVAAAELKKLMLAPGDGIVTRRSLTARTGSGPRTNFPAAKDSFHCEGHNDLVTNRKIQDDLLKALRGGP